MAARPCRTHFHIYICMFICMYVYSICMHACMCVCACVCVRVCVCVCRCVGVYVWAYECLYLFLYVCMYVNIGLWVKVRARAEKSEWSTSDTGSDYRALKPTFILTRKFVDSNRSKEVAITRLRLGRCMRPQFAAESPGSPRHSENCDECCVYRARQSRRKHRCKKRWSQE